MASRAIKSKSQTGEKKEKGSNNRGKTKKTSKNDQDFLNAFQQRLKGSGSPSRSPRRSPRKKAPKRNQENYVPFESSSSGYLPLFISIYFRKIKDFCQIIFLCKY